jgi:hypothetical protein
MTDQQALPNDGSIDSAALAIPDSALDVFTQPRGDGGRFAPKEPANDVRQQADDLKATPPGDNAQPKTEAAAEDEDDWLEIVEEDGKEPTRVKVGEVWQGYRRAKELEGEIEKVKAQPFLPEEIENAIVETTRERGKYMQAVQRALALNSPTPPDMDLVNPASPRYDPEAYYAGVQNYQRAAQQRQQLEAHYEQLQQQQAQEQEAVKAARWQREQAKLKQIWPEVLTDKSAQSRVRESLQKHYGIDDAFLSSELTLDHRIYALAKDALAYREGQAKAAEAVKVVRAKPKLIRGSARDQQSPTRRAASDARGRLAQSGSLEDAAAALDGLF